MSRREVDIPVLKAYRPYFEADNRHAMVYGGRGSGKSYAVAQKHILRAMTTPGERFLIVRKVYRTCRHSTFQLVRDILARARIEAAVNRSDMAIRLPNGSEILHAGLDDPQKLLSITGITSIWVEEADQITEADFEEVDVLMRGAPPTYFQTTLTFNPRRSKFWARRRFVDADAHAGAFVLRTTWRHNRHVGDEYGRRLAAIPDENLRAIYERGEWSEDVRGLIYPSFGIAPAPDGPPDAYGVDFGFANATAVVAIYERDPVLHVREVVYAAGMTTPQLIEALRDERVRTDVPMYCDAAQPGTIAELVAAGYDARQADKAVNDGIATVKRYQVQLTPDSPNIEAEVEAYRWAETRDGDMTDRPVKFADHAMDAMRYAAHSHIGVAAPTWTMW